MSRDRFPRALRPVALVPALALAVALTPVPLPASEGGMRRVAVPAAGSTAPRITVRIDPAEQVRLLAARPALPPPPAMPVALAPVAPPTGAADWFWALMPAGGGPGRLRAALAALEAAPPGRAVPAPTPQALRRIAGRHGAEILRASDGTAVSPALVLAVIAVESAGRTGAVSPKGAQGLMQLIPATARRFGVADAHDAAQNIRGGVAYLDWLLGHFGGDALLALAAYNAGEGAVRRAGGVPPYAETRAYVPRVLAAWRVARGLCRTPPELPTDACALLPVPGG